MTGSAPDRRPRREAGGSQDYATSYHAPVLCKAVVESLITDRSGTYVDATLGGGGHAAALLDALAPHGKVIGIDRDPDACAEAARRLERAVAAGRLTIVEGNFADVESLLDALGLSAIDGILLDLGVSSHQLDRPERGFSYMQDGPLDMRMEGKAGASASTWVNDTTEADLKRMLRELGEEPRAARITRAICSARPLATTSELADVVRSQVPPADRIKTVSRVFQAIRLAVNREIESLEQALISATHLTKGGGRIAVISYHSLEDRRVKRFLRYGNFEGESRKDLYGNLLSPWTPITRRPVSPAEDELEANPRARSARLRVAERTVDDLHAGDQQS